MGTTKDSTARVIAQAAVDALGTGFDVTKDYRLQFCKGPVVQFRQVHTKDLSIPGGIVISEAPRDVTCDKGERMRFTSEVMPYQQMAQWFNTNSCIDGKIPLGFFNAMYDLSGSWHDDATQTKSMAFDGYFITLYKLQLSRLNISLREEVKNDIPSTWDPEGLARFIEKYGTHIVVAVSIGGQDVLYLKESHSSSLSAKEIQKHLKSAGDQCFSEICSSTERSPIAKERKIMSSLMYQGNASQVHSAQILLGNKDLTILSRRRGGNSSSKSYNEWQETVNSFPDAISMSFVPITSVISGISGSGFLQHAVNLYIRHKPQVEDLRYFLDFQVPRQWIPVYNELPLGLLRKQVVSPSLQFRLMGPKLYVNTAEVLVGKRPITGIRLYLEGRRSNRLAVHLQHLSVLPKILEQFWGDSGHVDEPRWHGSTEANNNWFEPVQWKNFSHICTEPVKYQRQWQQGKGSAFVVTGARFEVKSHGLKNVLHLSLQFTEVPGCTIQKSQWDQPAVSHKSSFFSTLSTTFSSTTKPTKKPSPPVLTDSSVFPGRPPRLVQSPKLLKFVDTTELTRGPQDVPGHWVITAAKLEVENGKISLRVKYTLLNF